jgi:hypothetical protein
MAAMVVGILWSSIRQRQLNVWAADDPLAAAAREEWQRCDELSMVSQELVETRHYLAARFALDEYLEERWWWKNPASLAVARREWLLVAGWLEEIIAAHPTIEDPEGLENGLRTWQECGSDWEYVDGPDPE